MQETHLSITQHPLMGQILQQGPLQQFRRGVQGVLWTVDLSFLPICTEYLGMEAEKRAGRVKEGYSPECS